MSSAPVIAPEPLRPLRIALVGSPNAGKTTLFNALTGSRARVGNYAGVTVERREARLRDAARDVALLDLPGTYALRGETPDERIVGDVLAGTYPGEARPDAVLVVADATTLRRGLSVVLEVLARPIPAMLVLTMIDEERARGGHLEPERLAARLGIPVVGVVGHRGVGIPTVRRMLQHPEQWTRSTRPPAVATVPERFAWIDAVCAELGVSDLVPDTRTQRIDDVLLHPVGGLLVFAVVMILLFQSVFTWAVPAMDAIDATFTGLGHAVRDALPASWIADLVAEGVLAGVGSVLVFLPQLLILFVLIHLLQDVGYMARAAFVVDRLMGWVGLQGRSFVPLLSCFACAVPGIMATRTIAEPRDRIATILVAPFMTCSARLPVYTLLIAAFVPATTVWGPIGLQGLVMLGLYLLGATTALVSAALLKSTLLRGRPATFYMELPPYRMPTARLLGHQVWQSLWAFIRRAGTIIFAASVVLWVLINYPKAPPDPTRTPAAQAHADIEASAAAHVGRAIEPAIAPLGFDWRIGIGLVASLAAREVMVSTLAQIYAGGNEDYDGLRQALQAERARGAPGAFGAPTAYALLVFFVFALQCTSTVVVMARETGSWRWPALAFSYMLALAWTASFVTYRIASAFA
ncbi:MAG: ferrous iron transporter B [bacterium]|nr:ferrous iron transporter B [bacterium]